MGPAVKALAAEVMAAAAAAADLIAEVWLSRTILRASSVALSGGGRGGRARGERGIIEERGDEKETNGEREINRGGGERESSERRDTRW